MTTPDGFASPRRRLGIGAAVAVVIAALTGVTTWTERLLPGDVELTIAGAAAPNAGTAADAAGTLRPIRDGIVTAGRLVLPARGDAAVSADPPALSADPPEAEAAADPDLLDTVPVAAPARGRGDHDGHTISVARMRALREPDETGIDTDTVPARRVLDATRTLETAATRHRSTDDVPTRHPARGRIRLSTGEVIELDRAVVIGRRPRSTRVSGDELPRLVAVASPEQDISRSHLEIRPEREHVLVVDLDTTNGSLLRRVGQEPVRLHPGEATMVVSGDVVDLGDGVTVAFEDLP